MCTNTNGESQKLLIVFRILLVPVTITLARQNHILLYHLSIYYHIYLKLAPIYIGLTFEIQLY